mmetsp:Transcript_11559/g.33403  ORF Transcript_11559/g.33403 Transcript_11559/m.33403 type:complete len:81 (-) Transcript_11559:894-1136(-)
MLMMDDGALVDPRPPALVASGTQLGTATLLKVGCKEAETLGQAGSDVLAPALIKEAKAFTSRRKRLAKDCGGFKNGCLER